MSDLLIAIVLGIVEGLTEFVPVSSTGHLIVVGHLLGFTGERADTFEVVIQLGAILAVAVLYRRRLLSILMLGDATGVRGRRGLLLLSLTTLPALVLGAALRDVITGRLFSPATVALGWGVGGVGLLLVERYRPPPRKAALDSLDTRDAVLIGVFQCLALWPGVSRAAATIGGAMVLGVDRRSAAEYSFLAALPVISAATAFELYSSRDTLTAGDLPMFATGFLVAFLVAFVAVRLFTRVLATSTLRPYGWYRIAAASALALAIGVGWIDG